MYRSAFTNRLTIVVTPLKALMEDQVNALWKLGFYSSVEYINQDKRDELPQIYRRLAGGEISLLFITPERFRSGAFTKAFLQRFNNDQGLEYAVYDEAHCISQWGHEFRPDYLYSGKAVQRFREGSSRRFPVLLFSATVSEKIYQEFTQLFV
ncbi:DEAD/DEAH box helicase [Hymenobacter cellulosilyticus]|uniref:DNA 3'-5' helicase n=1 Tax=Hymenobacter cellulosilyticus TaxID=2932248 RepID=A0A8T9QHJ2_9BACT|nr:DEAD/DEAH box helicase [Hymenobacter cellulosilyticus]UOQ75300.1 DEAD/DEAH box helicase [Hymenobacter cellulosilyticus]